MSVFTSAQDLFRRYGASPPHLTLLQATSVFDVWQQVEATWEALLVQDPDVVQSKQLADTSTSYANNNQDITSRLRSGALSPHQVKSINVTAAQGDKVKTLYMKLWAFRKSATPSRADEYQVFFSTIANVFTGTSAELRTLCGHFNNYFLLDEISGYIAELDTGTFAPDMKYMGAMPRIHHYPLVRDTMTVTC